MSVLTVTSSTRGWCYSTLSWTLQPTGTAHGVDRASNQRQPALVRALVMSTRRDCCIAAGKVRYCMFSSLPFFLVYWMSAGPVSAESIPPSLYRMWSLYPSAPVFGLRLPLVAPLSHKSCLGKSSHVVAAGKLILPMHYNRLRWVGWCSGAYDGQP